MLEKVLYVCVCVCVCVCDRIFAMNLLHHHVLLLLISFFCVVLGFELRAFN
jgi:hypothetical protein